VDFMETLQTIFPSADDLLSTPMEDLAPILLKLAAARLQGAGFIPDAVTQVTIGTGFAATATGGYPGHRQAQVDAVLSKTWNWLEREGYIEPSPGMNGRNGWRVLTDMGQAVADGQDFRKLRAAMAFPKELLHPAIREKVWGALRRDELDEAVRTAFVGLEDAVRAAGNYAHGDFGVDLMRKAFHPDNGPLTNMKAHKPEREALSHLFAGAIGAWKNPVSHRGGVLVDLQEAQDQVMLASHLLRIVDTRQSSKP
jgi:uncharacterized protein (TIGR02391 family)